MLWKMAVRGVISNRRRTLFLSLSLALSSFVLAVGATLVASFQSSIEHGLRAGFAGDLQVYHADNPPPTLTSEAPAYFRTVPGAASTMEILQADVDVESVAPQSRASGILLVGEVMTPVVLVGLDTVADAAVLARLLPAGVQAPASSGWILLGGPQAERLQRAGASEEVTILLPTADGLFEGDVLHIAGTYTPPGLPFIDEFLAFVPLAHLQMLTDEEGYPGSLVVRLREGADLVAARGRLRRQLQAEGMPLEIATWDELAGDLLGTVEVGRYVVGSGFVLVLLVVILGITNTMLVLMLHRTREVGLMRALGTRRRPIVSALVAEVALLSLAASGAGAAIGGLLCAWLARVGIPASTQAMAYAFGGSRFFPEVHLEILLAGFLLVALVGPLVALAPAWRTSSSDPAEILRAPA
jgi:ABC-type lipoprotein release transport system permease subunit